MSKKESTKRSHKSKPVVKSESTEAVVEKTVASAPADAVRSSSTEQPGIPPASQERKHMDVTLTLNKAPRKSERIVIFNSPLNSVQFLRTAFGETIPETLTVSGDFAEPKASKVKETKEERKARLAALPKPTLADRVAAAEKRAADLKAKLAKATEAPAV